MANMMAYPELRFPFAESEIHPAGSSTVLYRNQSFTVASDGEELLVSADDLQRITGFELKPEGACYADACIPANPSWLVQQNGEDRILLTALADALRQPYVADTQHRVWSFAEIPLKRESLMTNAMAPEFEVTDRQGNVVRLADLKGKKALIVTWSSW